MEARNFIAAREAVTLDHWIFTTANDLPRYEKPPLPTWITTFFGTVFGFENTTMLRFPAALFATLLIICLYAFVVQFVKNANIAFISALVAATSYLIVFAGRNGQWDIYTHSFMMLSILLLFSFLHKEKTSYGIAFFAALCFGASFMSKGPIAAYTLFLPFIISYGIVFKFKNLSKKTVALLLFFIVALVVSGWWYVVTYLYDESLHTITQNEIGKWNSYRKKPFYYYFDFIIHNGTWIFPAAIALLYPLLKSKIHHVKEYRLSVLWTLISVLLLSIIPGKKSRYLLPTMIPLAITIGFYLEYVFTNYKTILRSKKTWMATWDIQIARVYFGIVGIICCTFCVSGFVFLKVASGVHLLWLIALAVILLMIGIYILRSLYLQNIQDCFYGVIACVIATMLLGLPLTRTFKTNPDYKGLADLQAWEAANSVKTYEFIDYTPEILWSYKGVLPEIEQEGNYVMPKYITFGLLVTEKDTPKFQEVFKDYYLEQVTHYDLNLKPKEHPSHKNRLTRTLYRVSTNPL